EAGEYFLRAFIDKEGGITIEDCVTVSREMNEILDREDYIADAYTFEVSSPGVERVLKKDAHFTAALGKEVAAKLFTPMDGQKEFAGILKAFSDADVTIEADGTEKVLQRKDIAKIHLAFTL
ncbi:MAG: ribosome maturation factor RimP, partial [Lachnospiraceae bacterium]|nr:ribosome maturation factor RimP [Lachnospiraceae bacterium]